MNKPTREWIIIPRVTSVVIFITFNASNCEKTLDFQQKKSVKFSPAAGKTVPLKCNPNNVSQPPPVPLKCVSHLSVWPLYVNLNYYRFRYVRYLSDICRYVRYLSDICRYLSDIGHIWNLGSFTKAILLQKCSISLICPDIAIRSRSSRSDWLRRTDGQIYGQMYGRTNMKNLRPPTQKAPSGQQRVVLDLSWAAQ